MNTIGLIISMALTIMVLSYILGDNPLFKVAEHIFIGASVGYAVLVAWHLVLVPAFFTIEPNPGLVTLLSKLPPALLCLLLALKILPAQKPLTATLGSIALAFLVGVGAAVAIGGALLGTLFPQAGATAAINLNPANPVYSNATSFWLHNEWLSNIVIIIGTVGTLFYFTFTHKPEGILSGFRGGWVNFWAGMGRWVILITFGALFANTVSARIALLLSRVLFLADGFKLLSQ